MHKKNHHSRELDTEMYLKIIFDLSLIHFIPNSLAAEKVVVPERVS